jgi:UDP-N-acetylmuramate: L-alanyl-gamma-D-glutamyl-meso-diaminopimelate ligase
MHIHILGICGTFMGGIAAIAKSLGHKVTGSDKNVYPPMSSQLLELGIELHQGYDAEQFTQEPDLVIIGNALSRGNPAVEYVLNRNMAYTSGPQWLLENVLKDRWVLAVSGTHGKTTTSSMLAWILEYAGFNPGYLIGGVPQNFGTSARLGDSPFFVIEADEYDSAFFDKRSKFVHYRPKTLIVNNIEFDHADIFSDLSDIQKQFHHLIRMVPATGLVLYPKDDNNAQHMLDMGCWTPTQTTQGNWQAPLVEQDGSVFDVVLDNKVVGQVNWQLIGQHNVNNGLMAIAAARHSGIDPNVAIEALSQFVNVKRRMEIKGQVNGVTVYDDFAHHPTAIASTIAGLRAKVGKDKIIAVLEPRSNTMKMGVHKQELINAWQQADHVLVLEPDNLTWRLGQLIENSQVQTSLYQDIDTMIDKILALSCPNSHVLIMSNGSFGGIHQTLLNALNNR